MKLWDRFTAGVRALFAKAPPPEIQASYDAARAAVWNANHWGNADSLSADAAHSRTVRQTISQRVRYEVSNNGQGEGGVRTHVHAVIGRGPKLRMQTASPGFNAMVEAQWARWSKAVKLPRCLRTQFRAQIVDGEGFLVVVDNPALDHPVKLGLKAVEQEQVTDGDALPPRTRDRVDGIRFDAYGNPEIYLILPEHPGGEFTGLNNSPESVPARFVFHLFRSDRPGAHRAVSQLASTANTFAGGRRWREATLRAAENIAAMSILLQTQEPPLNAVAPTPMTQMEFQHGMMVALPGNQNAFQPKPEQPPATYPQFHRISGGDQMRPLCMPTSVALADSVGTSFSGGRMDQVGYWPAIDVDDQDVETETLDPLFDLWYAEASRLFGWVIQDRTPDHSWDWPAKPTIHPIWRATADEKDLKDGVKSLATIHAGMGVDAEAELAATAEGYGISPDQLKAARFREAFPGQAHPSDDPSTTDQSLSSRTNRNGRLPAAGRFV
jgi:hypothetical protein